MASITAPLVETQQVVTGTMYQITLSEGANGNGITRLDIGPYRFPGAPPLVRYPEAPTNELCPPGFQQLHWVTDERGASYLRFEGGRITPRDGDVVFQFTSNFPPSTDGGAVLTVWRDSVSESFTVPLPDYTQQPPRLNSRHDSTGLGRVYKGAGCLPQFVLTALSVCAGAAMIAAQLFHGLQR